MYATKRTFTFSIPHILAFGFLVAFDDLAIFTVWPSLGTAEGP